MAEMVWCQSCSTVVWAYDHQCSCDLRGIVNMMGLPCPNCHRTHCFDGWGTNDIEEFIKRHQDLPGSIIGVFDAWSAMRFIAKENHVEWKPSGDNRWKIGAHEGLKLSIERWKAEKESTTDILLTAKLDGKIEAYYGLLGD